MAITSYVVCNANWVGYQFIQVPIAIYVQIVSYHFILPKKQHKSILNTNGTGYSIKYMTILIIIIAM